VKSNPDPKVILLMGVTGSGKTTTIQRLLSMLSAQGQRPAAQRGYSMIELVMAVALASAVTYTVLSAVQGQQDNARAAALITDVRDLQGAVQAAFADDQYAYAGLTTSAVIHRRLAPARWIASGELRNEFGQIQVTPSDAFQEGAGASPTFRIALPAMPVSVCITALPQLMEGFVRLEASSEVYFSPANVLNGNARGDIARRACSPGAAIILESA